MKKFLFIGAFFCFLGVLAGVLGSHVFKKLLTQMNSTANFSIATDYMFYHGFGLMGVGLMKGRSPETPFQFAGWLFVAGSIMFQGNLYLISVSGIRVFQILTPVGGICLMAGWLTLIILTARIKKEHISL